MRQFIYITLILLGTLFVNVNLSLSAASDMASVEKSLAQELSIDQTVEPVAENRKRLVKEFVNQLSKIDDYNLGDVTRFKSGAVDKESLQSDLARFKEELNRLVTTYHHTIKPILLNNIKLKRKDIEALQNKADLFRLFIANEHNYKTGKPVSGLLRHQQNISDSFFSKELVDAGLLVNLPLEAETEWVKGAVTMEAELQLLLAMHEEYLGGPKSQKKDAKKTATAKPEAVKPLSKSGQLEQRLQHEMPAGPGKVWSKDERMLLVADFVKQLANLDDLQLGDPALALQGNEAQARLAALQGELSQIEADYQKQIKPVLLENIKLKRKDIAAIKNKAELYTLFVPNAHNHKTGRPISGLLRYQQNVSDSLFGEKNVDAGLLVNFPQLETREWIADAVAFEAELLALQHMHVEYQDGVSFKEAVQSKVVVNQADSAGFDVESLSTGDRIDLVHGFVKSIYQLDATDAPEKFRKELEQIVATYQQKIKPLLVANVSLRLTDRGAEANKTELVSLFWPNRNNHGTGKPVSSKLSYEKDVDDSYFSQKLVRVGFLVDHPEIEQESFIKQAIEMEKELAILLQEHKDYLKVNVLGISKQF